MWVPSYDYLEHHGIKEQKWGIRRFQNPDGTLTDEGKRRYSKRVFVSGSSKTQDESSGYYRKELPNPIKDRLRQFVAEKAEIIVGDAPGIDRQVQNFLNDLGYSNVQVYGPGKSVRYSANSKWKTNPVDAPEFEVGSKEWLAKKDLEMERVSTEGLAIVLDEGSKATRKNIDRLISNNKFVDVFELSKDGKDYDRWTSHLSHHGDFAKETINMYTPSYDYLEHHGIKKQKWGVRNGPPYPLDYKSHTAAQKKANPKSVLSGNERQDRKAVKQAFKKARYARAATLAIEEEGKGSKRAYDKGKISKKTNDYMQKTTELAKKRELQYDKELNQLASQYVDKYGDKKLKGIDKGWNKTIEMTAGQGQRYVYGKGTVPMYLLTGVVGGAIKGGMNLKKYNDYKNSLHDNN